MIKEREQTKHAMDAKILYQQIKQELNSLRCSTIFNSTCVHSGRPRVILVTHRQSVSAMAFILCSHDGLNIYYSSCFQMFNFLSIQIQRVAIYRHFHLNNGFIFAAETFEKLIKIIPLSYINACNYSITKMCSAIRMS